MSENRGGLEPGASQTVTSKQRRISAYLGKCLQFGTKTGTTPRRLVPSTSIHFHALIFLIRKIYPKSETLVFFSMHCPKQSFKKRPTGLYFFKFAMIIIGLCAK